MKVSLFSLTVCMGLNMIEISQWINLFCSPSILQLHSLPWLLGYKMLSSMVYHSLLNTLWPNQNGELKGDASCTCVDTVKILHRSTATGAFHYSEERFIVPKCHPDSCAVVLAKKLWSDYKTLWIFYGIMDILWHYDTIGITDEWRYALGSRWDSKSTR